MKRLFALVLLIVVCGSLAACRLTLPFFNPTDVDASENQKEDVSTVENEDNTVTLTSLYPMLAALKTEDIAAVKIAQGYIAVSPVYNVPNVTQSTDERDIAYNLSFLQNATLKSKKYEICGGCYEELTLILKSGEEKAFTISNGFLNTGLSPMTLAFENYVENHPKIEYANE